MKKINLGIIGCGHWGPNFVRNFSKITGVSVKYACDLDKSRLLHIESIYPQIELISDYKRILRDKDIDAVVIATPAHTHYKLAKAFLSANKHVLVEKPIATTIAQSRRLIDVSLRENKLLMVGHTFKFNPGVNKLKELIKQKKLGKIYYLYSRRTNLGPLRKDVNVIWDLAPHDISIISYLLGGQPLEVSARGRKFLAHDLEDVAFMTLSYPKNIFVHVHVSWLDPRKVREIIVVGDKQMAVFDDLDMRHPVKVYDKSVVKKYFRQDYDSFREFQMIVKEGKIALPQLRLREPLEIECRHFIDCIRNNKTPLTDGLDGLNVLKVMVALEKSLAQEGKSIKIHGDKNGF